MRELLSDIDAWASAGKRVALATVAKAWGSAPRPLGSSMAVSSAGDIAGSVSGGCVEGAVAEEARLVLRSGRSKLVSYGVTDETAWSVGLSCGGRIEVFIEPCWQSEPNGPVEPAGRPATTLFTRLTERLRTERPTVRVVAVKGPATGKQLLIGRGGLIAGSLGLPALDAQVLDYSSDLFDRLSSERRQFVVGDEAHDLFIELHLPRPKLIIIGAVHVAIQLVKYARQLGYSTIVIDPRTVFATPERFSGADSLVSAWPQDVLPDIPVHSTTCFVFLSHDLKIDLPGLQFALSSPALYIGALGSKKTHAKRVAALAELGIPPEETARISSPIGLDLGGRRAEEIALSIMAEIVAVRYGKA